MNGPILIELLKEVQQLFGRGRVWQSKKPALHPGFFAGAFFVAHVTWLAGSSPTNMAAKQGNTPLCLINSSTLLAISWRIASAIFLPSINTVMVKLFVLVDLIARTRGDEPVAIGLQGNRKTAILTSPFQVATTSQVSFCTRRDLFGRYYSHMNQDPQTDVRRTQVEPSRRC